MSAFSLIRYPWYSVRTCLEHSGIILYVLFFLLLPHRAAYGIFRSQKRTDVQYHANTEVKRERETRPRNTVLKVKCGTKPNGHRHRPPATHHTERGKCPLSTRPVLTEAAASPFAL